MRSEIETLKTWITESDNIVFFGGAGVSTESNIPDFRSDNGLYKKQYPYPAEVMLSHSFYESNPKEFFEFYLLFLWNRFGWHCNLHCLRHCLNMNLLVASAIFSVKHPVNITVAFNYQI